MKKFFFINTFIALFLICNFSLSKETNHLEKGIELFNKKEFIKSKIFFERDLVFNPKSEKSYLYLAKIFKKQDNIEEEEINLKNVLLLNPQNDEAIYLLTLIKIEQSDYFEAESLINKFNLVCKKFCSKKKEIENKLKKLNPEKSKIKN